MALRSDEAHTSRLVPLRWTYTGETRTRTVPTTPAVGVGGRDVDRGIASSEELWTTFEGNHSILDGVKEWEWST